MPGPAETVREAIAPLLRRPGTGICVALSGGLDSSVLLHALVQAGAGPLRAIYVNHQLHPEAVQWGRHCQRLCRRLGVPFAVRLVTVDAGAGEGPEAAARRVRYGALAASLAAGEVLVTAHHQDDQAETVMLNLLRGAGIAGFAGIPREAGLGATRVLRPLLDVPRAVLAAYAREAGLDWVEDPSNSDVRMDRNFLRHRVLPVLEERWPGLRGSVARSARLCAEASELLEDLGVQDGRRMQRAGRVLVARLRELSEPRQRNALRCLCRDALGSVPSERRLREGLAQLLNAGEDRNPVLAWRGGEIRRYRSALYVLPPAGPPPVDPAEAWRVRPGAVLDLGAGAGRLRLVRARGQGLAAARIGAELTVTFRSGGERLRPAGSAHRRELKKLLQERGIVPWMRERIPMIYSGERLAAVAHLWVSADFAAGATEPGLRVRWDDHPRLE